MPKSNHEHKDHHHFHSHSIVNNIWFAFILNFSFTIIEFIGGFIFNSSAIIADAVHDLGDTLALGTTLFLEKRSLRAETPQYSFGYRRLSVLSGLLNALILIVGAVIMATHAIDKIYHPETVNGLGMIGLAVLGIIFNGLALFSMKKSHNNLNVKAIYFHFLEDVLGWVIVLIGAIFIYFYNWYIIDPILTLVLSVYIAYNAFKLLKPIYYILMETSPLEINLDDFKAAIVNVHNILSIHDLHIWSLDGNYHLMSAHFVVAKNLTKQEVIQLREETDKVCKQYNIYHTTIEIEFEEKYCH